MFRTLEGGFACEVQGLELWRGLDGALAAEIAERWSRQGLIIFRRQALDEDELVELAAQFGELDRIVRADWQSRQRPELTLISNLKDATGRSIGGLGAGELGWHSDQSYMARPATGSLLYMVEMPRTGGRTYWSSLRLAYEGLPEPLQRRAQGREAVFDYLARQSTYDDEAPMSPELRRKTPRVAHPLVSTHPVTGERALYLDPTTTVGVDGMEPAEGTALLDALNAHATRPEFVYAHRWQVGDLVMWDNGLVLHRRDPFPAQESRLLKRATLRLPAERHIVPAGRVLD